MSHPMAYPDQDHDRWGMHSVILRLAASTVGRWLGYPLARVICSWDVAEAMAARPRGVAAGIELIKP